MGLLQDTKNRIFIDSHHHFFNPDAWLSVHENQPHTKSAGGESRLTLHLQKHIKCRIFA